MHHRRPVEHVGVADVQGQSVHALQTHDGHSDRVGSMRRAGREYALATARASWREDLRSPSFILMEPEEDPDQLPAREILERVLEVAARQQLDPGRRAGRCPRLPGGLHFGGQGAPEKADGIEYETMHVQTPWSKSRRRANARSRAGAASGGSIRALAKIS